MGSNMKLKHAMEIALSYEVFNTIQYDNDFKAKMRLLNKVKDNLRTMASFIDDHRLEGKYTSRIWNYHNQDHLNLVVTFLRKYGYDVRIHTIDVILNRRYTHLTYTWKVAHNAI